MNTAATQPCKFPACAVHHICELPCHRSTSEGLANALDAMATVDFDDVFVRSAAQIRWLDDNNQNLIANLKCLLAEAESGIATCPLTRASARKAIDKAEGGAA